METLATDSTDEPPEEWPPGAAGSTRSNSEQSAGGGKANAGQSSAGIPRLSAGRVGTEALSGEAGEAGSSSSMAQGPTPGEPRDGDPRRTAGGAGFAESSQSPGPEDGQDGGRGAGGVSSETLDQAGSGGAKDRTDLAAVPSPPVSGLYFSEYVEGSSNNKALEISSVEPTFLDGCVIEVYLNGAVTPGRTLALGGELFAETPRVICDRQFAEPERCHQLGALSFNGNDLVRLVCAGRVLDSIGTSGEVPAEQWGSDDLGTRDMTLRRKCGLTDGDPMDRDPFDPAEEWVGAGLDVFNGLGSHCALGMGDP